VECPRLAHPRPQGRKHCASVANRSAPGVHDYTVKKLPSVPLAIPTTMSAIVILRCIWLPSTDANVSSMSGIWPCEPSSLRFGFAAM
jgi:hypothetical protein